MRIDDLKNVGITLILTPPNIEDDKNWEEANNTDGVKLEKIYTGVDANVYRLSVNGSVLYNKVKCATKDEEILQELFDKNTPIVIKENANLKICSKSPKQNYESNVIRESTTNPNSIKYNIVTEKNTILYVPVSFDKGWSAKVNGSSAEILDANHSFMAIEIPKGKNKVVFSYMPIGFKISIFLTATGIIFLSLGLGMSILLRKKEKA